MAIREAAMVAILKTTPENDLAEYVFGTLARNDVKVARVCLDVYRDSSRIDPDGLGGIGVLKELDRLNIRGDRLWAFYAGVCRQDVGVMLAVLRASDLGLLGLTKSRIDYSIEHRGEWIDIPAVMSAVQERLPNFNVAGSS